MLKIFLLVAGKAFLNRYCGDAQNHSRRVQMIFVVYGSKLKVGE